MNQLENKRLCPHCLAPLHEHPYLMARKAEANVLSWTFVAWVIVVVMLALVLSS